MITKLRRYRWIVTGKWKIKSQVKKASSTGKLKIILGSGGTNFDGWIATDLPHFDILNQLNWKYFFEHYRIDNLLAEHVLEHLTEDQVNIVLHNASQYLKHGAKFRIAVPDGFHPDPSYIDYVSPTGKTGSLHEHKTLWNYKSLSSAAAQAGYRVELLEYYTEDHVFKLSNYSFEDGYIKRCTKSNHKIAELKNYTSLVMDIIKT